MILTDRMMTPMGGLMTIKVLLRMNPQARIISASSLNANGMVAKVINAGVQTLHCQALHGRNIPKDVTCSPG